MKKKANPKILWQLFTSMFLLSSCTFGGGFVIVSLMKKKFVDEKKWLEEDEMLDITAITQSSPGPLPVNASVIIGYRMAGIAGSLTAIAGTILPPMIIISLISLCYERRHTGRHFESGRQHHQAAQRFLSGDDDSLLYRRSIFQCKCYGSDPHLPGSRDCKRRNHQSQKGGSIR